jgi:hypothetical protein
MKISGIIILFFFTMTYTQSLTIHKTDQTTVSFELTAIDSFTISTAAISKILAASDWTSLTAEQAVTEFDKESDICMEGDESLRIYGNGARQPKAIRPVQITGGLLSGKTIYLRWRAISADDPVELVLDFYADTIAWIPVCRSIGIMTDNCCESSADAWRYTRIVIAENAIVAGTAVNGYDDQGGMIVSKSEVNIAEPARTFSIGIKARKTNYLLLGETRIE